MASHKSITNIKSFQLILATEVPEDMGGGLEKDQDTEGGAGKLHEAGLTIYDNRVFRV